MNNKLPEFRVTRRDLLQGLAASALPLPKEFASLAELGDEINLEAYRHDPELIPIHDFLTTIIDWDADTSMIAKTTEALQNGEDIDFIDEVNFARTLVDSEKHLQNLRSELMHYGCKFIENPPSQRVIKKLFFDKDFQNTEYFTDALNSGNLAQAVHRFETMAGWNQDQLLNFINEKIATRSNIITQATKIAQMNTRISKLIESEQEKSSSRICVPSSSAFSDAASARKVAMYPVRDEPMNPFMQGKRIESALPAPTIVSNEEQQKLGIGLHAKPYASSCKHYGTISDRDEQLRAHYGQDKH